MGVPAFAWQSRYHEFVIRTEAELARTRHYILMNPTHWAKDPLNVGLDE
jgi:putative transposase